MHKLLAYVRYESEAALAAINALYADVSLLQQFSRRAGEKWNFASVL